MSRVDEPHEGNVSRLLVSLLLLRFSRRPELLLQAVPHNPKILHTTFDACLVQLCDKYEEAIVMSRYDL